MLHNTGQPFFEDDSRKLPIFRQIHSQESEDSEMNTCQLYGADVGRENEPAPCV